MIAAQFLVAIYYTVRLAMGPSEFLGLLVSFSDSCSLPVQLFPGIDLDAYKFCVYVRGRILELVFVVQIIAFGTPSLESVTCFYLRRSDVPAADVLAFAIIVLTTIRSGTRHPRIPSLLDIVLRDATSYFMLIFACHFCLVLFLFFAPVGDLRFARITAILSCSYPCMPRRQCRLCLDCRFISLT